METRLKPDEVADCECGIRITRKAGDKWRDSEGDARCAYPGPSTIPHELHKPAAPPEDTIASLRETISTLEARLDDVRGKAEGWHDRFTVELARERATISTLQADIEDFKILASGDAAELMRLRDEIATLTAPAKPVAPDQPAKEEI